MSMRYQSCANLIPIPMSIPRQSGANPFPIQYQSIQPILCQYDIYPKGILQSKANLMPIKCQSFPNPVLIGCQSKANMMPIECQSDVNRVPIRCQCIANLVPIWCQSNGNLMSIQCQFSNPMSTHCQSGNPLPILCQSSSNPVSIRFIHSRATDPPQQSNPFPIRCQFSVHPVPIQRQSITNPAPI